MIAEQSSQDLSALGTEKIPSLLLRFSLPAIIGATTTALYNFTDRVFVGHGVGTDGVAAVSISYPLMLIMIAFGMLIAFGGNTLAAISLGKNRQAEAERVLGNAFSLYLLMTVLFSIFGFSCMTTLLRLLGASGQTLPLAERYFSIILLGALGHEISFGMNSFIRVAGKPRVAMFTLLIGAGLNLLLDGVFIFVFDWGIQGAALATIVAQTISACWVMAFFLNDQSILKLRAGNLWLRAELVKQIIIAGSPMWLIAMAGCIAQALLNNRLQLLGGDEAVIVMGIIFSVYSLVKIPLSGLSQGSQPIISFNYAAANFQRVGKTLKLTLQAASLLVLICYSGILLFPHVLLRLFNLEDAHLLAMGSHGLRIYLLMLPLLGAQTVATLFFQAIGKPTISLFFTLTHHVFLLIPLVNILPRYLGLDGIWLAAPIAELVTFLVTVTCIRKEVRDLRQKCTTFSLANANA